MNFITYQATIKQSSITNTITINAINKRQAEKKIKQLLGTGKYSLTIKGVK